MLQAMNGMSRRVFFYEVEIIRGIEIIVQNQVDNLDAYTPVLKANLMFPLTKTSVMPQKVRLSSK
jgi:hypothetical protein